jgi:hypothetical protein
VKVVGFPCSIDMCVGGRKEGMVVGAEWNPSNFREAAYRENLTRGQVGRDATVVVVLVVHFYERTSTILK